MNKLRQVWNWLKEKWWLPLSGVAIIGISLLLKPKNKSLSVVNENKQIEEDIEELELEALRKENQQKIEAMARAGIKIQSLNDEKKRKEMEMMEKIRQRKNNLATRSNDELAKMLKKENEV